MVAQKSSGLPWFTLAYPLEGCHFSGERGRALRAPRRGLGGLAMRGFLRLPRTE